MRTDQILRYPRQKPKVTVASLLQSPTTLKVCNLAATIFAAALFFFVLAGIPILRHQREIGGAATSRAERAEMAARFAESKARMASKEWGMAAALTRQLLDKEPDNPVYLLQLAEALGQQDRSLEEATTWERFMLVSETPWFGCPRVGRAWARAGDDGRALASFERCYRLAPQNADVIFFLGREYEKKRRWREAKALFEKGLELSPGYVDLRLAAGRMLVVEDKADRAELVARDVLTTQPDNVDALLLLGSACRELGKTAEARVALERGISLSPQYSDFHFLLGRVAEDEGDRDEAIRWYRETLAIAPGRGDAGERLAIVERGGS